MTGDAVSNLGEKRVRRVVALTGGGVLLAGTVVLVLMFLIYGVMATIVFFTGGERCGDLKPAYQSGYTSHMRAFPPATVCEYQNGETIVVGPF